MSFWRKEEPLLGEPNEIGVRPVLKGGMFQAQREWWQLPNFIRAFVGGYGSGKTRQLCKWAIAASLYNAPVWNAIVSPNFPLARRTILPTIRQLLIGKSIVREDFEWAEDKGDHIFRFRLQGMPWATLLYLSGDNPDNLKGPNLGIAAIDEPFIQERAVFDQMMARCRDPRAKLHAIGVAGTPEDLNWGFDILEGEEKDKFDCGVVHVDTRHNLSLPPSYSSRLLASYDEKTAEAYISGKFVSLSKGLVFYGFSRDRNVKHANAEGVHFAGMDFNVNPMSVVIGWHRGERMHIYAEYEFPNSDTQYACSVIREKHPDVRIVFPDPAGKARHTNAPGGVSDFTYIQRAGLNPIAPNSAWPLRDSYNSVNAKLHKGELTISPSCVKLINYFMNYAHEKKKKQEAMSHLLDATRYPVTFVYPIWRPTSSVSTLQGA